MNLHEARGRIRYIHKQASEQADLLWSIAHHDSSLPININHVCNPNKSAPLIGDDFREAFYGLVDRKLMILRSNSPRRLIRNDELLLKIFSS